MLEKVFPTKDDAKSYASGLRPGSWKKAVLKNGQKLILCRDDRDYEEELWDDLSGVLGRFFEDFGYDPEDFDLIGSVSSLRDMAILICFYPGPFV